MFFKGIMACKALDLLVISFGKVFQVPVDLILYDCRHGVFFFGGVRVYLKRRGILGEVVFRGGVKAARPRHLAFIV